MTVRYSKEFSFLNHFYSFQIKMGNLIASVWESQSIGSGGSKRKVEEVDGDDDDSLDLNSVLHTPKK